MVWSCSTSAYPHHGYFDLPLVLTLRIVGDMGLCPVRVCFGRLEDSYFMVTSASVYLSTAFLATHVRQLNHPNPLVSASSRNMLINYTWRFSPPMPCLDSHEECDPHRDDHSRRLRLWHELGWTLHVPRSWSILSTAHPLGTATSQRDVLEVHTWMCLGLTPSKAVQGGNRVPPIQTNDNLPPVLSVSAPVDSLVLDLPEEGIWVILHDASLHQSTGYGGGGVMFFDLVSRRILTWHFSIPVTTDNSFQAESYVAWVVLRSLVAGVTSGMVVGDYKDRATLTVCDSLSYINALEVKQKYDTDYFADSIINTFRGPMSQNICTPMCRAHFWMTS